MKQQRLQALISGLILMGLCVTALEAQLVEVKERKNRFSLNSHVGFNIKANFRNLGGRPAVTDPGLAMGGVDHVYDDGFNRVDISNNVNAQTWNWGYDNVAQLPGNDTLVLTSSSATADGMLQDVNDGPQWGAEISYARQLGWDGSYWWGVDIGFSWLNLSFKEDASLSTSVQRTRDTYFLNGIIPPNAPYSGTFNGPGPLISDTPTRTMDTLGGAGLTSGQYELEGEMYAIRLGLIYETPITERLLLQFGGGGVGALVNTEFSFTETTSIGGVNSLRTTGSDTNMDAVGGAYALIGVTYRITEAIALNLSGQYNYLTEYTQSTGGREAEIDFAHSIYLAAGIGIVF